jgi:hypothetical protein
MGALGFDGFPGMGVATALPGLLDQADVALAALDGNGRLSMLSPGLATVMGRTAGAIPAEELPEALQLHTDDGSRLLSPAELPLVRARAGERVRNALITTRRPDGALRLLRCNALPVPASDGNHRGAVSLTEDVTEAPNGSRTYQQLRTGMMDWINHELRTPLAALRGHIELLADPEMNLPSRVASSVAAMDRATQRLTTLAETFTALGNGDDALLGGEVRNVAGGVNARLLERPSAEALAGASCRTTSYTVYPTGFDEIAHPLRRHWLLRVEDAGDGWAIRWRSRCLNYRREWELEPPAKSRTNDFLRRCRFSERAAIRRAQQAVHELVVDGLTYPDFVAQVRVEAAEKARAALRDGGSADLSGCAAPGGARPVLPLAFRLRPKGSANNVRSDGSR